MVRTLESMKPRGWTPYLFVCLIAALGWTLYSSSQRQRPFVRPHIGAPSYIWSYSCPEAPYGTQIRAGQRENIPKGCANNEYIFPIADALSYGLPWPGPRNPKNYYRVGNDLILIDCFTLSSDCAARYAILDAVYQPDVSVGSSHDVEQDRRVGSTGKTSSLHSF
jgi:hypothetical protein